MGAKLMYGGKITASHTTVTEVGAEVANCAQKLQQITKIALGGIRRARGGRRDIKFHFINGGIKARVRGNGAVQDLFLYTKAPVEVVQIITQVFRK